MDSTAPTAAVDEHLPAGSHAHDAEPRRDRSRGQALPGSGHRCRTRAAAATAPTNASRTSYGVRPPTAPGADGGVRPRRATSKKARAGDDGSKGSDRTASCAPLGSAGEHRSGGGRDRNRVRDQRGDPGSGKCAALLEARLEHACAGRGTGDQGDQGQEPDATERDELRRDVPVGEQQPSRSPRAAALARRVRTSPENAAQAAASQMTTPTPCGGWDDGLMPTSEMASSTSPISASLTASCSCRESRLGVAAHAQECEHGDALTR